MHRTIIHTIVLTAAIAVAAAAVAGEKGDPTASRHAMVEGAGIPLHHPGMGRSPTTLRYQRAYDWVHARWTGSSQEVDTAADADYEAAVERASSAEVFARIEAVLRSGGDLDSVRRGLSAAHDILDWDPDWIAAGSGQVRSSGYYLRDDRGVPVGARLTVTEAMAVRLIAQACFEPMDTYLRRPPGLDRSLSMVPEGRVSTRYKPAPEEARAVLAPAYTRCIEFISRDGRYLPDGTSLEGVVEQRVSGHIRRVLDPAE